MSKTTPEEALQRATKHRINLMYSSDFVKLAALIDEVRGVDAEPSITVHKDASGVVWLNFVAPSGTKAMLSLNNVINDRSNTFTTRAMADAINAYTHPAPSQPAAPVELPASKIVSISLDYGIMGNTPQIIDFARAVIRAAGRKAS